jgi:hypothetical protein
MLRMCMSLDRSWRAFVLQQGPIVFLLTMMTAMWYDLVERIVYNAWLRQCLSYSLGIVLSFRDCAFDVLILEYWLDRGCESEM